MKAGIVKWMDLQMSCGFIIPDDHSPNIFIHVSQLKKSGSFIPYNGQKIQYEILKHPANSFSPFIQYSVVA